VFQFKSYFVQAYGATEEEAQALEEKAIWTVTEIGYILNDISSYVFNQTSSNRLDVTMRSNWQEESKIDFSQV